MSFEFLIALGLAVVLGLRHASDPDHLVAVTALTATDGRGQRAAVRFGAWWGLGHALTLVVVGLPLIALWPLSRGRLLGSSPDPPSSRSTGRW